MRKILLFVLVSSLAGWSAAKEIVPVLEFNQVNMNVRSDAPGNWKYSGKGELKIEARKAPNGTTLLQFGEGQLRHATLYQERPNSRRYAPNGIADRFYQVEANVAGQGRVRVGVRDLATAEHASKNIHWSEWIDLSDRWVEIELEGQVSSPYLTQHELVFEASPGSEVQLYDVEFEYKQTDTDDLDISPRSVFAAAGDTVSFVLTADSDKVTVRRYDDVNGSNLVEEFEVDPGQWEWTIPQDAEGAFRMTVSIPEKGQSHLLYVQAVPSEVLAELDQVASEIKLKDDMHLLIIGDSLTDFHRGYNYANIVDYFLNKYNPDKFSFRNAGIGGDYITRVWSRVQHLEGNRASPAWRQEMYQDLLDPDPDQVLIFLGANDTKASSRNDYATPTVSTDVQRETYRKLLDYLREEDEPVFTFIACPSFNSEVTRANAQRAKERGRAHSLFGIDEYIVHFNSVLADLSEEYNAGYIDLFSLTVADPNKNDLYYPSDGVHLTDKGHQMVALEILKHWRDSSKGSGLDQ